MLLSASGVRLNVSAPRIYKTQRPAVFIFNHRNYFYLDHRLANLGQLDWRGPRRNCCHPISGALGRLVDTIYVDRDDTASAVKSPHKPNSCRERTFGDDLTAGHRERYHRGRTLQRGASASPWRPRHPGGAGGDPQRRGHRAQGSPGPSPAWSTWRSFRPSPSRLDSANPWPAAIDAVRQLYLDTLADWPVDELPQTERSVRPGRKSCSVADLIGYLASFTAADDALVLASVGSSAERELLNNWLEEQRRNNPGVQLTMLQLPDVDPSPVQVARLSDQLG